jgi:excisionase family DNA binding protein
MREVDGLGWLRALELRLLRHEVQKLKEGLPARRDAQRELRVSAEAKIASGSLLTREEVAAYLGVSTRKIQRMEAAGTLTRCPGLGSVVRFAARDVLRLASAR